MSWEPATPHTVVSELVTLLPSGLHGAQRLCRLLTHSLFAHPSNQEPPQGVSYFPMAVVTNYHVLGGLKQQKLNSLTLLEANSQGVVRFGSLWGF